MGAPYNPFGFNISTPIDPYNPIGDLGNVFVDSDGNAEFEFAYDDVLLVGNYSVLGRGISISQNPSDFGLGGTEMS